MSRFRAWPSRPATSDSPGTPTAACSRCSARPCSMSTASTSSTPSKPPSRPRASATTSTWTRPTCRTSSRRSRALSGRKPAGTSRRTPGSSWTWPSRPCSTPGTRPARSATGAQGVYGDYLQNAQGEDVVAGIRNTVPLQDLESIDKASYDQLMQIMQTLENHYRDLCDIEVTIERGKLWMLQTRVGKRTAGAACRIATQLVQQDMIGLDEALTRVTGEELARLMFPR